MLNNRTILVVVPARGGSKGVPHKNIHPLAGKPLIGHVGELLRQLPWIDRAIVSTDDPQIAETAIKYGIDAPFMRPAELSGDLIADVGVLTHALETMESCDHKRYDVILMLQPTSPLRQPNHVRETVDKLIEGGWDAVWTVSPTDLKFHPLKQLRLGSDGAFDYWDPEGSQIIARQQLQAVYHRNGAAYACTRACLLEQKTLKGQRSAAVIIQEPMISIDTLNDFSTVEQLLTGSHVNH